MSFRSIIEELDTQIATLQSARELLMKADEGHSAVTALVPRRPITLAAGEQRPRRTMSAEARKKIGAASRKRWKERRQLAKEAAGK